MCAPIALGDFCHLFSNPHLYIEINTSQFSEHHVAHTRAMDEGAVQRGLLAGNLEQTFVNRHRESHGAHNFISSGIIFF